MNEPSPQDPSDAAPSAPGRGLPSRSADEEPSPRTWPDHEALRPLAPVVYVAWADGVLGPEELRLIREHVRATASQAPEVRRVLEEWLDPESPPTAEELRSLRQRLQLEASAPATVSDAARPADLDGVDPALGKAADEAIRDAIGTGREPARRGALEEPAEAGAAATSAQPAPEFVPPAISGAARFDPEALSAYLIGERAPRRQAVLELLTRPQFALRHGLSSADHRAQVMDWLRILADEGFGRIGFPVEHGGEGDLAGAIYTFEAMAFHDHSLLVKYGVQFGLWGGSVYQLGTPRQHQRWLPDIMSLELPGCFAMTELGHGSNVRDIETRALYDPATAEFVVTSPTPDAAKDWIGNAAADGRAATVFAQLEVDGEDHGVHALVVPIRDDQHRPMPGVTITDRGLKQGLNGVDNGQIRFDGVRVPRENLLDRFAAVDEQGRYSSPIASPSRRFFTMLGTLVAGRISIAAGALSASKVGLATAIRFSDRRRQFGPAGEPEIPVLHYLTQQRLLFPHLARAYALDFAIAELIRRYDDHQEDPDREPGDHESREIEVLAAGLKAAASRHANRALQAGREACGGRGYDADARFASLLPDTNVFLTFEGANVVLLQLVAKGLLGEYASAMSDMNLFDIARFLADRAAARVTELNPVVTRRTDPEHLRDAGFQVDALVYRERRLLASAARRLKRRIDDGVDSSVAMNEVQDHLVALAQAHVDRVVLEAMVRGEEACPDPEVRKHALRPLRQLLGLSTLERDRAWFLEAGYFETAKSRAVRAEVNALCGELRPVAVDLVEGFGIPEKLLGDTGPG